MMLRPRLMARHWQAHVFFLLFAAVLALGCRATPTTAPSAASPTAAPPMAALQPCSDTTVSQLQPATTTPTPAPAAPTPTPSAPPSPTPTPRPAPQVDRVGFPEGYKEDYKLFFVFDRADTRSIQYVCANDKAASVKQGEPFPFGSVLTFETWRPKQEGGNLVKDERGRLIRESLNAIFVMRKEPGFGTEYQALRNGEWEYVAYRPDKTHLVTPQNTANCAACHQAGVGPAQDWVFRTNLFFKDKYGQAPVPGPNEAQMSRMSFFPNSLLVKAGTTVKWTNSAVDELDHTVTANDQSFDSGIMKPGAGFSYTFNTPGTFQYICALHPDQMRARIQVTN